MSGQDRSEPSWGMRRVWFLIKSQNLIKLENSLVHFLGSYI